MDSIVFLQGTWSCKEWDYKFLCIDISFLCVLVCVCMWWVLGVLSAISVILWVLGNHDYIHPRHLAYFNVKTPSGYFTPCHFFFYCCCCQACWPPSSSCRGLMKTVQFKLFSFFTRHIYFPLCLILIQDILSTLLALSRWTSCDQSASLLWHICTGSQLPFNNLRLHPQACHVAVC